MCVTHTRRTTTTYDYLISRLSAIDTAGFFKGEWKENYYVCGVYKKNDNNVQLPHISAVSYRYGWFLQRSMERELLCVWRIQEGTTTTYDYLKYRLSAIDTAGFFKGEWKENYYVCGAYKKNDNNVRLPQISAVSYRYGWFLQR